MNKLLAAATFGALALSTPAAAATEIFFENFERPSLLPNGGAGSGFTTIAAGNNIGPWTAGPNGIELQWGGTAGQPAPGIGGRVFVELDTNRNSSMFHTLASSGVFTLEFLYSPRPNVVAASNVIEVLVNGSIKETFTGPASGTNPSTNWVGKSVSFTGLAGQKVELRAAGTNDSRGGYIDNTRLTLTSAIPEPGTWMLMILGLGAVGFAMRRRPKTSVRFQFA